MATATLRPAETIPEVPLSHDRERPTDPAFWDTRVPSRVR